MSRRREARLLMPHKKDAREAFLDALVYDDPVQLYERAPCGFLSTTPDGVIVKANATFRTWVGRDARELVGTMSFVDLLTPGGRIYHETHYAPALRMQGAVREIALDLLRPDGSRLPVLVSARLDRADDGEPQVIRIAVFDATDRRQYERQLVQAKQAAEEAEVRARAYARTLQETLIPPTPPEIPLLDLAAAYRSAGADTEVGGDFYDVFPVAQDDYVVVVGDVCGKGVEAAVVTALVRHTLRALAVGHESPSDVLQRLNTVLLQHGSERFCTVALVRLRRDAEGWSVVLATGGHPLPLLRRAGQAPAPFGAQGALLGVFDDPVLSETSTRLAPGDLLLLYTDGVTEGRHAGELYGDARFQTVVGEAGEHSAEVVDAVLGEVLAFQDGVPRDDIALLALAVPAD